MVSMSDRGEVIAALTGTLLEGRDVNEVVLPDPDEVTFEIEIELAELRPVWQLARGLVDRLGRWPLAVGRFGHSVYDRFEYRGQDSGPAAIRRRASLLTITDVLDVDTKNYAESRARDWSALLERHLTKTRQRVGEAPSVEDVARAVHAGDEIALERLLLGYEDERRPLSEIEFDGYMAWGKPREGCKLTFLPTWRTEETLAYVSWFGSGQTSPEHALCGLRSWNTRFGAELVASWGTMLDFVVRRPPEDLDAAFALATEHAAIAPATMGLAGLTIRDHARALMHRREWQLHERP
ncbi:MAG: hypothetical protein QOF86_3621 [Baekduia sp.]|nr:hypothetical protein [Baekduia sp.]